jgi:hypothetical protein
MEVRIGNTWRYVDIIGILKSAFAADFKVGFSSTMILPHS